jgi:hypothetical protein
MTVIRSACLRSASNNLSIIKVSFSSDTTMARIYQTSSMGEAHVRVAIVADRGMADLLVHRVSSWGLARGDAHWFVTRNKQDASALVYFTSAGFAQVNIHFVDRASEAGWQKPSAYRGRFG